MTSRALPAAALAAALFLGPATLRAGHGHHGRGVSTHHDGDMVRCSDLTIDFDDRPAQRAEQAMTVPVDAGRPLRVRAAENSGISVRGADRSDFQVTLCKGAGDAADLSAIAITRDNGVLSVRGPASEDWVGYLIIESPRNAAIDLGAENGPVSISDLAGRVVLRSENGPISIRRSPGDIDAHAQNGPIAVQGDAGRLRLATENGPIAVALTGASWNGEGLEARAVNGPVSLAVPAGYRSGTLVQSLGHSPFQCRGEACSGMRRTWDDEHKSLELGDGPVVVRLSTDNGPVSIRTGTEPDEDDD